MRLADPVYLLLLLLLPPWLWLYVKRRPEKAIRFSDTRLVTRLLVYRAPRVAPHLPFIFRFTAAILMIVALARPQTGYREEEITSQGIDIMLTLDISSSMTASDFKPDRLGAAKAVIAEFIKGRVNDRMGLVVFAAQGFTQCPLTLDYGTLTSFLESSNIGLIEDGTAIGMALATAANRMKDSPAKSRIVILLTDGMNNRGAIDPLTAAQLAKAVGVKVYTIGVGREGLYYQTVNDPQFGPRRVKVRTEIDEQLLVNIARTTGGRYFRAEDETALAKIYQEIDSLEKTDIRVKVYVRHTDWFMYMLIPALGLLLAELSLPLTRWRVAP
ncbi:MAG: VWA domain-containing protein [Nitrospinae bacterium]|nr:VWA domain-containing protein [Nitrospinota bacterium]